MTPHHITVQLLLALLFAGHACAQTIRIAGTGTPDIEVTQPGQPRRLVSPGKPIEVSQTGGKSGRIQVDETSVTRTVRVEAVSGLDIEALGMAVSLDSGGVWQAALLPGDEVKVSWDKAVIAPLPVDPGEYSKMLKPDKKQADAIASEDMPSKESEKRNQAKTSDEKVKDVKISKTDEAPSPPKEQPASEGPTPAPLKDIVGPVRPPKEQPPSGQPAPVKQKQGYVSYTLVMSSGSKTWEVKEDTDFAQALKNAGVKPEELKSTIVVQREGKTYIPDPSETVKEGDVWTIIQ